MSANNIALNNDSRLMTEISPETDRSVGKPVPISKAMVIVNAEVPGINSKNLKMSPVTQKMVAALKQAIESDPGKGITVELIAAGTLWSRSDRVNLDERHGICCPLTIQLPDSLIFPGSAVYQACKDIDGRRQWVAENLGYKTNIGNFRTGDMWLPIAYSDRGIVYGDAIAEGAIPNDYQQPLHLSKKVYKSLYRLADKLLESLSAIPSVYLLQFSLLGQEVVFDRLWPFPAAPALASLRSPKPDLFACHWSCLTGKPIRGMNRE